MKDITFLYKCCYTIVKKKRKHFHGKYVKNITINAKIFSGISDQQKSKMRKEYTRINVELELPKISN